MREFTSTQYALEILRRSRRYARGVLGLSAANRALTVRPDDIFLVSFPRSGNTWLRFLIGNLLDPPGSTDFLSIERQSPDIYTTSDRVMQRLPGRRIIKSHEYFDPRYGTVVLAVRDPRDIVASYYRYQVNFGIIPLGFPGAEFLEKFVTNRAASTGTWQEHTGSWLGARSGDPNFLLVRYEDLLTQAKDVACRLCAFLGVERSEDEVEAAVEASSRSRMRDLEPLQRSRAKILRDRRLDVPFVGPGIAAPPIDGNESYLRNDASRERIETAFSRIMSELGYSSNS